MVTLWEDPDERGSGCPNILPILTCGSSGHLTLRVQYMDSRSTYALSHRGSACGICEGHSQDATKAGWER